MFHTHTTDIDSSKPAINAGWFAVGKQRQLMQPMNIAHSLVSQLLLHRTAVTLLMCSCVAGYFKQHSNSFAL